MRGSSGNRHTPRISGRAVFRGRGSGSISYAVFCLKKKTKVSVRRGGEIIMDARKTRGALTAGRSLDMLHMQAGDELEVGKRRQFNWGVIVPSVSALLGVAIALSQ